jgi:hypothetical protein
VTAAELAKLIHDYLIEPAPRTTFERPAKLELVNPSELRGAIGPHEIWATFGETKLVVTVKSK